MMFDRLPLGTENDNDYTQDTVTECQRDISLSDGLSDSI